VLVHVDVDRTAAVPLSERQRAALEAIAVPVGATPDDRLHTAPSRRTMGECPSPTAPPG
jgi:hypothetical protein